MKLTKKIYALAVAIVFVATASAQTTKSFADVRALVTEDKFTVTESLIIEGVVVSDSESPNMDQNPNLSTSRIDLTGNLRSAYIQSLDGEYGFRIRFRAAEDNELRRYSVVKIDLKGTTIVKKYNPERYTITDVGVANIISYKRGDSSLVPRKERTIGELSDKDVYTYVTLKNVEFIFKEGSYTNIWEPYCIKSDLHKVEKPYDVTSRMDGWASLLRDTDNNAIYMLVNTLCQWRRTGKRIPQGMVELSGIVVSSKIRRHGNDMGKFQIRPVDEHDIVPQKGKSPYKNILSWTYDGNSDYSANFEIAGYKTGLEWKKEVKGDRLMPDYGKGFMWTTSDSFFVLCDDVNDITTQNRGKVRCGAIGFDGSTTSWFIFNADKNVIGTNSIFIEFSTAKIKGTHLGLAFDFGAGKQNADSSWQYPAQWKVEFSVDGKKWTLLKDSATDQIITNLRPLPFWPAKLKLLNDGKVKPTGYDCGMGLQQHAYALPASAFGCEKVLLRITPANNKLAQIRSKAENDIVTDHGVVSPNCRQTTFLRFGSIYIYYK